MISMKLLSNIARRKRCLPSSDFALHEDDGSATDDVGEDVTSEGSNSGVDQGSSSQRECDLRTNEFK